jgi:hypothetical protein
MSDELMPPANPVAAQGQERIAALVRAIRRAHQSPSGYGGLVSFHVADIHEFTRRLVEQGVRAAEPEADEPPA